MWDQGSWTVWGCCLTSSVEDSWSEPFYALPYIYTWASSHIYN